MSIQTINIGNLVNDGLGDDLRTAFQKVNSNFSELSASLTITAANIAGTNGVGIFKEKVGSQLRFKTLKAGSGIAVTEFTDVVEIRSTQEDGFQQIDTDNGVLKASQNQLITIQGGQNISVTADNSQVITIDTKDNINSILTNYDFGTISSNPENVIQLILSSTSIDFGSIATPSGLNLDLGSI